MLRAIWFILRLGALVFAVAWVIEHPGKVRINWQGYVIDTSTAFLLGFITLAVVGFALIYRFYRAFISVPKSVRRYREVQGRENGYLAITRGLAAVAAGDTRNALRHATRAKKLLPAASLTGLLSAQAALLNEDEVQAKLEFEALLDDKNASFFGIRGLMNLAHQNNNQARLVELMEHAETIAPKQPWIIKQLFEHEASQGKWKKAEQTLSKAVRLGAIERSLGEKYRQAILLARGMEAERQNILHSAVSLAKKAHRIDVGFVPASLFYARLLLETNRQRAAVKIVEKAWKQNQHPGLFELWLSMVPPVRKKNATQEDIAEHKYNWVNRLHKLVPYGSTSNAMIGKAAMDAGKLEEARAFFKTAGDYRMLAKLEILETGNEAQAREWLEMAAEVASKPAWVCKSCGFIEGKDWHPLCHSCGLFYSFEWTRPNPGSYGGKQIALFEDAILGAPAAQA